MWKVSLYYLQNWQNYAAFSHGNLAVERLSKIVSTVQDSANAVKCEHFFWVEINALNVFHHRSRTLIKLLVKRGTALLIKPEPAENCPISSPVRLLIQKMFWASDKGFKIASCVAPQKCYSFKFGELLSGHCSFSSISDSRGGIVERHV